MSKSNGWVGVDLDGTLAVYDKWNGPTSIGAPVAPVVSFVQELLRNNVEVRIMTARYQEGARAIIAIEDWCIRHIGCRLEVTDRKDMSMVYLIDDRAVTVERNTGKLLAVPPSIESIREHWTGPTAPPMEFKRD